MSIELSPSVFTILQLLQARQLYIGDELRLNTLRMAWNESGGAPEEFPQAIDELVRRGFVRQIKSTRGQAVSLTSTGFRASATIKAPVKASPPPTPPPGPAPQPNAIQSTARKTPPAGSDSLITRPLPKTQLPPKPSQPPAPAQHYPAQETSLSRESTRTSLEHSAVFRTRESSLNDNVLRHCLLGLMMHYRLRPEGQISYDCVMRHWDEMGLSKSDLLYALDLLIRENLVRTTTRPKEMIILSTAGFELSRGAPKNLDDGMDRWRAKKRLRLTKQLGNLPAA